MYSLHESLIHFSSTITLPDTPFRQFDPVISCLSFTICFAIRKISFWCSGSVRSLAHSFCFFSFAEEITLFALCFCYSSYTPSVTRLSNFIFSIFCTLSCFPLLLQEPPHSTIVFPEVCKDLLTCHVCAVLFPSLFHHYSIIIFFILCQCSFISRCFQFSSSILSLTILLYSSQICSSLSFHPCTLGSNFLCRLFCCIKPHVHY